MSKKLLVLLCMLFIQSSNICYAEIGFEPYEAKENEQVFNQEIYSISAIDPTMVTNIGGSLYPGLRGSNQLIIYTPQYGQATGTNEFGTEAVVVGDTVTSLSGADSLIPPDGFVISAHGKAKKWMNENIFVGSKIYVDRANMQITSAVTSDSFIFGAKEKIAEAQNIMCYYEQNSFTYDSKTPYLYIKKARQYLNKAERNPANVQRYATLAINAANCALATSVPYKSNELKGIWIRPNNTTEDSIIETLDIISAAGIDNVFLETYYHGKTIFPSITMKKYGFIEQNELFVGLDPLKIWIEEAHKRNIKINIWFESFYVGNTPPTNNSKSILAVKPTWGNINKRNIDTVTPSQSLSEHNGYFLDPANPEVQTFLTSLIREIILNYQPDGINLDYIRYPQSMAAKYPGYVQSNWGYTPFAREEFKIIYGEDPANLTQTTPLWAAWDAYRRDKVTNFVEKVSNICRINKVSLTAVVFPNKTAALESKQQNWSAWSANNLIDGFTPLFLTCDSKTIATMISDMLKEMSPRTKLYAGLFVTFMGGSEEDLIRQIHETRKQNLSGIVIFDYAHLEERYIKTLTTSAFTNNFSAQTQLPKKMKRYKD